MRRIALLFLIAAAAMFAQKPQYASKAELKAPAGYREWYFVGSNLGISYSVNPGKENFFKNIYIQRSAAETFKKTGVFPEKTMVVMEIYKPATNAAPAKQGQFEGEYVGYEVAVKDKTAVEEGWAYYNFIGENGRDRATAKANPRENCWSCHNKHGAKDNVFVQFYPRLRDKD